MEWIVASIAANIAGWEEEGNCKQAEAEELNEADRSD